MAQLEASLHHRSSEVVYPVPKADGLIHFDIVFDRERGRCGRVEDPKLPHHHLDLSRGKLRVGRLGPSRLDTAAHGEHVLGANLLGPPVRLGRRVRLEHHLSQPGPIAKIDKDNPAVVSTTVDPAEQHHILADVVRAKAPTQVCTPQVSEEI
jgi:hypothetical protein